MFINCWVEKPLFMETMQTCWDREVDGTSMWRFHHKLKRLANTLRAFKERYWEYFSKCHNV